VQRLLKIKKCRWKSRRRVRPVQCSGDARVQCPQRLLLMQLTHEVSWCSSVDGSERNGPKLEVNMLTDRQPVQLPPQLGGTGTTWRLNNHTRERVLDTLKAVEVALRGAIEQTVAVVETCTDDTQCNRFGSIECQTWTDVEELNVVRLRCSPFYINMTLRHSLGLNVLKLRPIVTKFGTSVDCGKTQLSGVQIFDICPQNIFTPF